MDFDSVIPSCIRRSRSFARADSVLSCVNIEENPNGRRFWFRANGISARSGIWARFLHSSQTRVIIEDLRGGMWGGWRSGSSPPAVSQKSSPPVHTDPLIGPCIRFSKTPLQPLAREGAVVGQTSADLSSMARRKSEVNGLLATRGNGRLICHAVNRVAGLLTNTMLKGCVTVL